MSRPLTTYTGAVIFDGFTRHHDAALVVLGQKIVAILHGSDIVADSHRVALNGGLIAPGLVDLQVNGGGGVMLNNSPDIDAIRTICDAHASFGTTSLLATLITDTTGQTRAAVVATKKALAQEIPGIIGLHLEGPHLAVSRKGAHDPALIRAMAPEDYDQALYAAAELPSLLMTLAPESVSNQQIRGLTDAGAIVSLGHTDAAIGTASMAVRNGATCVTHLFNAMSQLGNRAPGLVGAALDEGSLYAGLIADGIHVDATNIRIALRAKNGPGKIFLVSDAMATIGSDIQQFNLNGRTIYRRDGHLTLADGTLAGADLELASAVRYMVDSIGLSQDEALRMATLYPAELLGRSSEIGCLAPGARADFIHFDDALNIQKVWRGGTSV